MSISQQEIELLNKFIRTTKQQEELQVRDLISNCNNRFQFAKTHSAYVKDWEKTKALFQQRIELNQLPTNISVQLMRAMINAGDEIVNEKLRKVREGFQLKFHESIYNYLGNDGKTKKFLGIF